MFAGRLMPGPPAASLRGPIAVLDGRAGHELIDLLEARIAALKPDPDDENVLGIAMKHTSREVTRMLMPTLRAPQRSSRRRARAA